MTKGKCFFMILMGLMIVMNSCTNDQNENGINMLDSNQNKIFSVLKTDIGYKINNEELDAYIRKDLKLPQSHSLDNIELTYNNEEGKGAIIIQYKELSLRKVSIGFTFSKRDIKGTEVLSLGTGKKYKCESPTNEGCWECCQIIFSGKDSVFSCTCGIQYSNGQFCDINTHEEDYCELTAINGHSGQGN